MVHSIRSTRSIYNLANKQRTAAFLVCSGGDQPQLSTLLAALASLAYSDLSAEATPPKGCAILTISDKVEVHLVLQVRVLVFFTFLSL